jgi:tripartite-type tricarboxylate transporter receptor subunit TctC
VLKQVLSLVSMVAAGLTSSAVAAETVADFYRGKQITMHIGYPVGGSFDVGARLVARHMGKHIPGNPSFIPMNKPGAAGLILANEMFSTLPQDGTAVGTFGRNIARGQVLGTMATQFDSGKFNWLGSTTQDVSVCGVWHTAGVASTEQFLKTPLVMAANSAGDAEMYPNVLNKLIGTNFKVVSGYPGAPEMSLALERGEAQARCGWSWSSASTERNWLKDKKIMVPLVLGTDKLKEMPDVPRAIDFARTDEARGVLQFLADSGKLGRPFVAPPNVPADRLAALRNAFAKTMEDEEFKADAAKQGFIADPLSGADLQKTVQNMADASPAVLQAVKAVVP